MICIYHSRDLDGFTSGAIVRRKYPNAKLIGFDYGQRLPIEEIPSGESIIMIDVSLPMEEMESLAKHSNFNLTWIDHHISAINGYKKYTEGKETFLNAILQDGIAACELGWKYLFPNENIPASVTLLGRYDTWRNHDKGEWNEMILPFQYGMKLICNSPESFPTDLFASNDDLVLGIVKNGKVVIKYQQTQNELFCKKAAFEHSLNGYKAICLNIGMASSMVFQSVYDETKHDLMMPFYFNGSQWIFSLYTTKDGVDCSVIAKSMGGGGHKQAAGFEMDDLEIFNKVK